MSSLLKPKSSGKNIVKIVFLIIKRKKLRYLEMLFLISSLWVSGLMYVIETELKNFFLLF